MSKVPSGRCCVCLCANREELPARLLCLHFPWALCEGSAVMTSSQMLTPAKRQGLRPRNRRSWRLFPHLCRRKIIYSSVFFLIRTQDNFVFESVLELNKHWNRAGEQKNTVTLKTPLRLRAWQCKTKVNI